MKTNAMIFGMMVVGANLLAQTNADPSGGEKQAAKMKAELSLTDEQIGRIKEINGKFRSEQARVRADTTLTRQKALEERRRMLDERESQIQDILTDDQVAKWEDMKRGRRSSEKSKVPRENPAEEMKTALDISDEQVKKITAINSRMSRQFKKLRADTTITRASASRGMKKILDDRNAEIKSLLTEDQYLKFVAYEAEKEKQRRGGERPTRP